MIHETCQENTINLGLLWTH